MLTLARQEIYKLIRRTDFHIFNLFILLASIVIAFYQKNDASVNRFDYIFSFGNQTITFLSLFMIIMASTLISTEFSNHTIKNLLDRSYSRLQVFISKLFIIVFYYFNLLVVSFLSSIIASVLFLHHGAFSNKVWSIMGKTLATNSIYLVLMISFIILISYIAKSTGAAIGLGVALLFSSTIIMSLLTVLIHKYEWLKFNPFTFLLTNASIETPSFSKIVGLNTTEMIIGTFVYSIIFYGIAYYIFKKRNI